MPKTTIPPATYANFAAQHKRLRNMKQGQFIQWATSFWQSAYDEGFDAAEKQYTQHGVNVSEDVDASVYSADMLYDDLLTIRGIGPKRATAIIDKILEGN